MAATDFVSGRFPIQGADIPYKNTSGSAISVGQLLKLDTANPMGAGQSVPGMTPTTAVADVAEGVAIENVPAGQYGRCQIEGVVVCIALGAIAIGATVGPSTTAGQVTTYTAANPSIGKAWTAAVTAADPIFVRLNGSKNA